jgi:microcystin-dependent protein
VGGLVTTQGHKILEAEDGIPHDHEIADVAGLQAALDGKAASDHSHAGGVSGAAWGDITGSLSDQTDLQTALDAKSDFSGAYADLTGKPTLGTAAAKNTGTGANDVATGDHTHAGGGSALDAWPVGSVYIAVDSTSPATRFGGGTWAAFGAGRMLVGINASDTDFDTAEETGGAKTVTLTAAQSGLPQHTHLQNAHTHIQNAHNHVITSQTATTGSATSYEHGTLDTSSAETEATEVTANATAVNQDATAVNQNAGPTDAAQAHNNVPPYIVVYMWKRTA